MRITSICPTRRVAAAAAMLAGISPAGLRLDAAKPSSAATPPPPEAIRQSPVLDVGARKQLFVDYKFIQSAEGVSLTMNPPRRTGEPVITADAPWEKKLHVAHYCSVQAEGGRIRVWYSVADAARDFMAVAYAESTDGLHFTKPVLNLVEHDGSRANNFVLPTDPTALSVGGGSVLRDENPACPPTERYKSWMKIYPKKGSSIRGPSRLWVSPDGLQWKLSEHPVTGVRATDTQSSWFWEPRLGRYIGYTREWVQFAGENRIRMASYSESDDMLAWEKSMVILQPDETDWAALIRPQVVMSRMALERGTILTARPVPPKQAANAAEPRPAEPFADEVPTPGAPVDVYGPGILPYREAEGVYVAFIAMFHHWDVVDGAVFPETGDVRLGVSRDARHFTQPGGRKPFLGVGPAGTFDTKFLWPLLGNPIRMGDELWIYYFGSNLDHAQRIDVAAKEPLAAISRAVMRLDGFVSADFDYTGGTLLTPPLRFVGSRLELNLDTGAGGMGRVEILDEFGEPIHGFTLAEADPINGNNAHTIVSWRRKSDLSALAGRTVRLIFKMRSAKLYAFQFQ